jgi:hypothetical protein
MSTRFARLAALIVALAHVRPAAAQQNDVNIELKGTLATFTAGNGTPQIPVPKQSGASVKLRVTCGSPFDCTKVTMEGDAKDRVSRETPTDTLVVFTVPGGPSEVAFKGRIHHDRKPATNELAFAPAEAQGGSGGSGGGSTPTLAQQVAGWLATPCPVPAGTHLSGADIVMTPFGRVLNQPPAQFDDDDKVTVSVLADSRVTHLIAVREASDLTRPVVTNIYGADSPIFKEQATGGQAGAAPAATCVLTDPEPLGPFATPKGVAQVTVYDGTALKDLGSAQFVVAPLYTGAFMLGAIGTELAAPTYSKAFNGTDTVIVERETGHRLLYTATYTHFWRKRDLTRSLPSDRLLEAITPMVGVVLNEAASNAVAGVNIELRPGLGVVVGRHFGRVTVLDESTGARVGQEFENRGDVPTERKWKSANFYGLNIDVRAASGLLRSLLGSGK